MKTKQQWTSGTRLDSVMTVLLIVFALGMLGMGAYTTETSMTNLTATANRNT